MENFDEARKKLEELQQYASRLAKPQLNSAITKLKTAVSVSATTRNEAIECISCLDKLQKESIILYNEIKSADTYFKSQEEQLKIAQNGAISEIKCDEINLSANRMKLLQVASSRMRLRLIPSIEFTANITHLSVSNSVLLAYIFIDQDLVELCLNQATKRSKKEWIIRLVSISKNLAGLNPIVGPLVMIADILKTISTDTQLAAAKLENDRVTELDVLIDLLNRWIEASKCFSEQLTSISSMNNRFLNTTEKMKIELEPIFNQVYQDNG